MSQKETLSDISQDPVNILFNQSKIAKKDVWEIDLAKILDILIGILERSGKKDLRVAGMAALSSSLIYRMKVDSIFALQKAAMEKKSPVQRTNVDIEMIGIPYRHESTYPVTLDELLGILKGLLGSIANPKSNRMRLVEPAEAPNFQDYMVSVEDIIVKYEDLIMRKIHDTGHGLLGSITASLEPIDAIRCFFAVLFLARDGKIDVEQAGDDIKMTMISNSTADAV